MSQHFPKPFTSHFGDSIKVNIDLSNYATKTDLKNMTHVDTPSFELKTNLANLKSEVDKLDIDKLAPVPVDLSKLSDVLKNDVVKNTVYDKLVAKVDNIDTSHFVLKTKYNTGKTELEKKIPNVTDFVKKVKLTELENKILDISNLATKAALTTVENKTPDVSSLVKKTGYNTKVTEVENKRNNHNHDKCIDTSEFNKLAADVFNARLAQANLITKTDFDTKLSSLNRKITQNKTKHLFAENELTTLENKIPNVSSLVKKTDYNTKVAEIDGKITENKNLLDKVKSFLLLYVLGDIMFNSGDGSQAYLIFQPVHKYIKIIANIGNLKDCLMKTLKVFLHLITVLDH